MLVISVRDKDSVTRQDIEKQHEMRRACIRTSVALSQLASPSTTTSDHVVNLDITPNFAKYIKDLRTNRESASDYQTFTEELRNTGLGAATMRSLSEMASLRASSGRGELMVTE